MGKREDARRSVLKTGLVLVILLLIVVPALGLTQVRKPTTANDLEGATTDPGNATDFPHVYNVNTSAETVTPADDASVNWTDWDTVEVQPYTALSVTVTADASGFTTDEWGLFFDNTTDTACTSSDWTLRSIGAGGPSDPTNITAVLPPEQDLSVLEVCLVGNVVTGTDTTRTVQTFDVRTNGTVDTTAPLWRNQQQNVSQPLQEEPVNLVGQGQDAVNLSHAVLATNETGRWQNKTGNYSSPLTLYTASMWTWSNFTWNNASVTAGTTVGWRIWYNDTAGNYNVTDELSFTLQPPILNVSLANPPTPFTATQNETFLLNATVTCLYADCGAVTGEARYNNTGTTPDTTISSTSDKPFHVTQKSNPLTCDAALLQGETCNVTWQVNATGTDGSVWAIDVNVSSDQSNVERNDTDDAQVEISAFAIEIMLRWDFIDFGELFVGTTDNPAVNNTDKSYNITVTDSTTENVDIWMNMTDLSQEDGDDVIGVTNMSANTADDPGTANPLTHTFTRLISSVAPGTNVTTFYWLDTPLGIFADNYTGTMWVKANATQ